MALSESQEYMADIRSFDDMKEAGFGDFVQLLKPRVMSLVVFTALVGLLVAPGRKTMVPAGTLISWLAAPKPHEISAPPLHMPLLSQGYAGTALWCLANPPAVGARLLWLRAIPPKSALS